MTELSSLVISYSGLPPSSLRTFRLRLEQIKPLEGGSKYATMRRLNEMWLQATTGKSPALHRAGDCPVEFEGETVRIFLEFYVWPSELATPYTLRLAMGRLDTDHGAQRVDRLKEFSIFIDNETEHELKYYMRDIESALWETPTFDRYGAEIEPPTMEVINGNTIKFSTEVFGCLRLRGWVAGFKYRIIMEISKPVDTDPQGVQPAAPPGDENVHLIGALPEYWNWNAPIIENLENVLTAVWMSDGEEQAVELRLEIPECVEALLKMCPNFYKTIVLLCQEVSTLRIFYNACTGELLRAVPGKDPQSFCTPLFDGDRVTVSPGIGTL